ncbi:hypothetical protein M8818_007848 [Zalaria obscura]|uniref:Uncharacterized protein n=1 Tax=Zalaria obscura TaxID=2024903 RepID=A0ACC3S398_9PEZI
MSDSHPVPPPKSILILGSGVFGLSTAYSLATNPSFQDTKITLLDRFPFLAPDAASIDSSRIVRADYADLAYASLAHEAQVKWRTGEYGEGVYNETGLALVVAKAGREGETDGSGNGELGREYMRKSLENVQNLGMRVGTKEDGADITVLENRAQIESITTCGGGSGDFGYANWRSGWADAEKAMARLHRLVEETGRVERKQGEVRRLLFSSADATDKVEGAELIDGSFLRADLTVLATGAWTPKFLDLRGIASATGQILAYTELSQEEQDRLGKNPTLLNESTGMFIIPPQGRVLKVARHGYGYANPTTISNPEKPGETITVSLPRTKQDDPNLGIAEEGLQACRKALREMIPELGDRPFTYTRICWYTDTANGDWIVSYHPRYQGLFVATGGSGHAFKFLPVVGDQIVECILGKTPEAFKNKWSFPQRGAEDQVWTEDWRGGKRGMILDEELKRGSKISEKL